MIGRKEVQPVALACPCDGGQAESGWLFRGRYRGETCVA
jgi:hypothetical protein